MLPTLASSAIDCLREYQSYVDSQHRLSLCGPTLLSLVSQLKTATEEYLSFFSNSEHILLQYLFHEGIVKLSQPQQCFSEIYHMAYQLTERPKLNNNNNNNQPTSSSSQKPSIPVDPESAFNILQVGGDVRVRMYNDNETLLHYKPSVLLSRPNISERIEKIQDYYDEECERMAEFIAKFSAVLHDTERMSDSLRKAREHWLRVMRLLDKEEGGEGGLRKRLREQVEIVEKERVKERENMRDYPENIVSRFNECPQLLDNLLRSYRLTLTQQRRDDVIVSLF